LILLILIGIFLYKKLTQKEEVVDTINNEQKEEVKEEVVVEPEESIEVHEIFETIDGQLAYIAVDSKFEKKKDFPIVIYSHGSTYSVTQDPNNQLLKDLRVYADTFVKEGYIFAASNQHGDNWGNAAAIKDTRKLVEYIKSNFATSDEIYLIGFSMGGLPTMNFAEKYPQGIVKIALLAPTTYATTWNSTRVENIRNIPIHIWHGNKDVNVPYSLTTSFIARLKAHGKEVTLVTIDGKGHWDVDTELIPEILEYFKQ
jgi:dipeptidyl aminopeptidase/acylaminoacyl peptidase